MPLVPESSFHDTLPELITNTIDKARTQTQAVPAAVWDALVRLLIDPVTKRSLTQKELADLARMLLDSMASTSTNPDHQ